MGCSSCDQKYIQPDANASIPPAAAPTGSRYIPPTVYERIIKEQAEIVAAQQAIDAALAAAAKVAAEVVVEEVKKDE